MAETPKFHRFKEPRTSSPGSAPSSTRPIPSFLEDSKTFSTKKERGPQPARPPPRPQIKTCPPISRIFKRRPELSSAQSVTFLDSAKSSSLYEAPLRDSTVYDSGKKASYFEQAFIIESKIGAGCFGNVYRVRSKDDGQLFAVKIARERYRGITDRREKLEEVRKHQYLLPFTNCVHFYQSWEENGRLYQQFELCEKSLNEVSEEKHDLPEKLIWSYLVDLLLAVQHLHDHDLIHMDIKPENIFIGMDGICKLGDFGLVIDLGKADNNHFVEGDPKYLAAEVLHERKFSKAADIFALGASILELACDLDLPKQGPLWHELRQTGPDPKLTSHLSAELRRLIQLMMVNDWERRPTVKQLLQLPSVQNALKSRARDLYIGNLVRSVQSFFLPVYLMFVSFFLLISKPFVSAATHFRKLVRLSPSHSTPVHLIRKSDSEDESEDLKPENPTTGFLNFLTSTAKKKQKKQTSFSSDDDDDDDNDDSTLSSSRSVLASMLSYSDEHSDEADRQEIDVQRQLNEDLRERRFRFVERVDGGTSGESPNFDFPTPLKARRRPLNDLVKTTPSGLMRAKSRIPKTPAWTPKKKLDFELDQYEHDESPSSISHSRMFDPNSSFGFSGSRITSDPHEMSPGSLTIKPLNLAAKFDCYSDSDEENNE